MGPGKRQPPPIWAIRGLSAAAASPGTSAIPNPPPKQAETPREITCLGLIEKIPMDRDPALKRVYESRKGQDAKRKVDTFCKEGAVYHDYFAEIQKDLLSELEKEERDERVIAARAEQHRLYREPVTR